MSHRPFHLLIVAFAAVLGWPAPAVLADEVDDARAALVTAFAAKLSALATWCDEQKLPDEAARTRAWLPAHDPLVLRLPLLPRAAELPPAAEAPEERRQWHARFQELRAAQADALFSLAQKAYQARRPILAYELALWAARENPEHAAARRVLGYERYEGQWHTPYEVDRLQGGYVWHERFGWLKRDRVPRYEAGERYRNGKWLSAEEDARQAVGINKSWELLTEHYLIRTDHSLEAGVQSAAPLERLYRVWQQVFVTFAASEVQMNRWFAGKRPLETPLIRHQVSVFRNRDEYNRNLKPFQNRIEMTTGYYSADARQAYFFIGPEQDGSTLNHEATHQLFDELRGRRRNFGISANFWISEGIACYMESLVEREGFYELGGVPVRLADARHRLVNDAFYVPLAELVSLDSRELQTDNRIAKLYSQSAGLTHFLMHYQNGRYRGALVDYLAAVYSGRDRESTLAELTGTSFADLDRQYAEFLRDLPAAPATP